MPSKPRKHIIIVGAGLVGSLAAIYLARRGYEVCVYEKRDDSRISNHYGGRSINLALSCRGLRALEEVGLKEEIEKDAVPMPQRIIHNIDGTIVKQPYGKEGDYLLSVSRRRLNEVLLDAAEKKYGVKVKFNTKCLGVDLEKGIVRFTKSKYTDEKFELENVKADLIVGADGVHSSVRLQMQKFARYITFQLIYILDLILNNFTFHMVIKNFVYLL